MKYTAAKKLYLVHMNLKAFIPIAPYCGVCALPPLY